MRGWEARSSMYALSSASIVGQGDVVFFLLMHTSHSVRGTSICTPLDYKTRVSAMARIQ